MSEIFEFIMRITLFYSHVSDNGGERMVDDSEKYFIRYKECITIHTV